MWLPPPRGRNFSSFLYTAHVGQNFNSTGYSKRVGQRISLRPSRLSVGRAKQFTSMKTVEGIQEPPGLLTTRPPGEGSWCEKSMILFNLWSIVDKTIICKITTWLPRFWCYCIYCTNYKQCGNVPSIHMCTIFMMQSATQSQGSSLCTENCLIFKKSTATNILTHYTSKVLRSISDTNIKLHQQIAGYLR